MQTREGGEIQKVNVREVLNELFELDNKVARATPALLPLETPEELYKFLEEEHKSDTYILRDENGKMVAYLSVLNFDAESMEVLNLGVDPDLQGGGLGRKMMNFAEELASEQGKKKIRLVTNVKNDQAVNFYKKIGYVIVKEAENYYGDGETRYIFERSLVR